LKKLAG